MAEDKKTTESKETKDDQLSSLSIGDIRNLVSEVAKNIIGTGKSTEESAHEKASEHTDRSLSRKSDAADATETVVRRELEKMKHREASDARDAEIDALLKREREKPEEKAPVERRRVHRFMGWGD